MLQGEKYTEQDTLERVSGGTGQNISSRHNLMGYKTQSPGELHLQQQHSSQQQHFQLERGWGGIRVVATKKMCFKLRLGGVAFFCLENIGEEKKKKKRTDQNWFP